MISRPHSLLFIKIFWRKKFLKKNRKKNGRKFSKALSKLTFARIVLLISIPFIPSFFVNMGAGFSKIPVKKYFYALIIGKMFVVLFWGYVGKNLLDCLTNPVALVKIIVMVCVAYLVATIVNKRFDLDGRF